MEAIDFTHSSRKAWQTINRLSGRKSTPRRYPVTAVAIASQPLKNGHFPGADRHFTRQLCSFLSTCFRKTKLPKSWRRASVIALPKPNKSADDPKSYRPISLLSVPYKILERLIHSRNEPVVDPQVVDHATLLAQDIEDSFEANNKAGVVLLDLTAAYDTVWHRGLHLKLLRVIPDRHMVRFIMERLPNRSFVLQTSDSQTSRLRRLRNGVPQGSVLSPMLFNIYIYDLAWKALEDGLNLDMGVMAEYLQKWHLQFSTRKTVSAAYHPNNRETRRELDIYVGNNRLVFQQAPKYLGVCLDRTLSYKQHLDEAKAKTTARVALIRCLAGSTWGAAPQTLQFSTQALVLPVAEYCAPAWSRSLHVNKVDTVINSALRIVTGCVPASASWNCSSWPPTGCGHPHPGEKSPKE